MELLVKVFSFLIFNKWPPYFFQVILGAGFAKAAHSNIIVSPSLTHIIVGLVAPKM